MDLKAPPPKRQSIRQGRRVFFSELQFLFYALSHFPPNTEEVAPDSLVCGQSSKQRLGARNDINNSQGKRFEATHSDCQLVVSLLYSSADTPEAIDFKSPFYSASDATSFMPVILLPPVRQCCGCNLLIQNRPSHARVYTSHGTEIAAVFTGECRMCHQKYHHSYSEKTADRDSAAERSYYSPDQEYFQLSSKTFFSIDFMEEVSLTPHGKWKNIVKSKVKWRPDVATYRTVATNSRRGEGAMT